MRKIIPGVLSRLEYFNSKVKLNVLKTIYFNFRTMPLRQAVKLPVYIYGRVRLMPLNGRVEINAPLKKGMVKLGRNTDCFSAPKKCALIYMEHGSRLIFDGPVSFSIDYTLYLRQNARLRIGEYTRFGAGVKFLCENSITVGKYSSIAFDCQFIDTNFHYTVNTNDNTVSNKTKPIVTGAFNWIGNKSSIMKGARTQDYTIVTSNSLLNKDYTADDLPAPMLGGSPAKIIGHGYKRILSLKQESRVKAFFATDPDSDRFVFPEPFHDTPEDLANLF